MKKYLLLFLISLALSFTACEYFESDNPSGVSKIDINITNLKPLADSLVYVGWVSTNADSSFKIFESNVDQIGVISQSLTHDFGGLHKAQQFIVTVEELPDSGTITEPNGAVIISGRFTLGSSRVRIGEGDEFSNASGVYTVTTPTDTLDNNLSGIWFVGSASDPEGGLNIPALHEDWIYEGLIIINDDTLSTGTFTDPQSPDESSEYSGTASAFPFPGEDFLLNPPAGFTFPLDLSNAKVLVTIDFTGADNIPSYYSVLFEGTVPAGVQANSSHQLVYTDPPIPQGMVSITVDVVE